MEKLKVPLYLEKRALARTYSTVRRTGIYACGEHGCPGTANRTVPQRGVLIETGSDAGNCSQEFPASSVQGRLQR